MASLQSLKDDPLDGCPEVARVTDRARKVSWRIGNGFPPVGMLAQFILLTRCLCRYASEVLKINPDSVWLDLCRNSDEAKDYCRVFLRSYVVESVRPFPILGSQEYELRRTMTTASAVLQRWRDITAEADRTVLLEKRRKEKRCEEKGPLWRLKFVDHANKRGQGPIYEISNWIFKHLAKEFDLATTLTFDKVEVTDEDIAVLLTTLWERAADVPCKPRVRVSIHGIFLLAGIGGFRKSTILRVAYKDVALVVVRDPDDSSKTMLIVRPTIPKNKQKRASMEASRAEKISFSLTLVPYPLICLASLVGAFAVKDNAFKTGFRSVEALLYQLNLEDVDFVPLQWKEEMLDRPIFEVDHNTLHDLWHRLWLVSGSRGDPRFHAMRVALEAHLMVSQNDTECIQHESAL
ncbi:uncharacterized protein BDR25DRAFT_125887 [Lindgomyces ingoldianus]|uniref:Uncharacterized protein n=1 Tax=Lindgomyces ingoldianus TaxID=673940 RepID=A0ACB6R3Y6_9PLEO|nr:uncharacterized protein BDR25DRAFT_125887 [Lindgomyces ingoldianus]KAF2473896.1 hypothetical protein BDR25DRAFT_125887 [Lindgomyces ingoldianus]